jgi:hypothetical protein
MLLFADNFEQYGINSGATMIDYMQDGVWTQVQDGTGTLAITDDPDPTADAASVAVRFPTGNGGNTDRLRYAFPGGGKTTIGWSFRVYPAGLTSADGAGLNWDLRDVANAAQIRFYIQTTGGIAVYRGATLLGATSGPAVTANTWSHIECKVFISDTVGTVEIRVNGTQVLSLTGIDTKNTANTTYDQIEFYLPQIPLTTGGYTFFKDFVLWDTSGTRNNNFMGPCFLGRYTTSADVSFNWTPSTGTTGYNLLDETGPNDADYISAAWPAPAASTFDMPNLPADVTSVRGIVLFGRMKKSDGGDCNVQMSLVEGGTPTNGTDRAITTAETYWYDVLELNTRTGNPFTPTEFNNSTFKVNRTL